MKFNLACGTDVRDGWINCDVVHKWPLADRPCDVIWDARTDCIPFPDGSADEVYAGYLLLHLSPHHHDRVLRDIHRVLKPGGVFTCGEVDMREVISRWLMNPRDARLSELIWGEQGTLSPEQEAQLGPGGVAEQRRLMDYDKHCHGYVEETLREALRQAGVTQAAQRVRIHAEEVWYEMTLKVVR
jgi:ubiquinone/menaquinone biosynthesis C-methylase UbiE